MKPNLQWSIMNYAIKWGGILLLAALLSGCISVDPSTNQVDKPVIGLGIDIPQDHPEEGPYLESQEHLQALKKFLRLEGKQMLEECGRPESIQSVENRLEAGAVLEAVHRLIRECGKPIRDMRTHLAEDAMEKSEELEVRDELHEYALIAVENTLNKLNAHPGPSNLVEAQLLHQLNYAHMLTWGAIDGALRTWEYYADGTSRDLHTLVNSYLGHLSAKVDSETIIQILDRYPWGEALCEPPDLDELVERTRKKYDFALQLAQENAAPEDRYRSGTWYGRLEVDYIPITQYYMDEGWWVSIMPMEILAEMHIAYWENRTSATAWPTMEEAEYLLAEYRNNTRTLWTDHILYKYGFFFNDERTQQMVDWETDLNMGAVGFIAHMSINPPYMDLQCN